MISQKSRVKFKFKNDKSPVTAKSIVKSKKKKKNSLKILNK